MLLQTKLHLIHVRPKTVRRVCVVTSQVVRCSDAARRVTFVDLDRDRFTTREDAAVRMQ
jgi:hypothetical protein